MIITPPWGSGTEKNIGEKKRLSIPGTSLIQSDTLDFNCVANTGLYKQSVRWEKPTGQKSVCEWAAVDQPFQ